MIMEIPKGNSTPLMCGCKGIRTCLVCENNAGIRYANDSVNQNMALDYTFCTVCAAFYNEVATQCCERHDRDRRLTLESIVVIDDFITPEEEEELARSVRGIPWVLSQSGRRKQDFGPKVNFKKQKLRVDAFRGFPAFVAFILRRMCNDVGCLADFLPVELCHLEYDPTRGAAIDPHIDDAWLWGRRLVTLSLCSDTTLILTHSQRREHLHIPLKRRSLLVLSGEARYEWMHEIRRNHLTDTRIALTFRELSPEFQSNGARKDIGDELLRRAQWILDI